ncbi:hypothetical protein JTB14_015583 [Gonioctena quinquepunctata]|nr:hypothetical protein JTB14_015583 [Gonioctena quinquepunctata]
MSRYTSDNVRYWKYPIPKNRTEFKLLMRQNDSTEKTEWDQLYLSPPPADKKNEPTLPKELEFEKAPLFSRTSTLTQIIITLIVSWVVYPVMNPKGDSSSSDNEEVMENEDDENGTAPDPASNQFEFSWYDYSGNHKTFRFTGNEGIQVDLAKNLTPVAAFDLFFSPPPPPP